MGGSKSSQTQQTSNTSVQQSFVDNSETYTDNSDNSEFYQDNSQVTDIYQDNSDNSEFYQDNSQVTDIYQDNSDNREILMDGVGAGANVGGNFTVTAGGAFSTVDGAVLAMRDTVTSALDAGVEQSYLANQLSGRALESNERVTRDALVTAENVSTRAIDRVSDVAADSIYNSASTARYAIDGSVELGYLTADTLRKAAADTTAANSAATTQAIAASNQAMERNAALIQTTALGGQDLLIDMVKKVMIGVAVSLGAAGVSYAIFGGKK